MLNNNIVSQFPFLLLISYHLVTALMACKMFKELARKAKVLREIELHHDLKKNAEYKFCENIINSNVFSKKKINLLILICNNLSVSYEIVSTTTL